MDIFQGDTDNLNVEQMSQKKVGALEHVNDCGPTCGSMLIKAYTGIYKTPDSLYIEFGIVGDSYLSVSQVASMLDKYGIPSTTVWGATLSTLYNCVSEKTPAIALIRYLPLYTAGLTSLTAPKDFNHFVVVVGVTARYVTIHDPYNDNGANIKVPLDVFKECWSTVVPPYLFQKPLIKLGTNVVPPNPTITRMVSIASGNLNVRSGPGMEYSVLKTIPQGLQVYSADSFAQDKMDPNKQWVHLINLGTVNPSGWCAGWLMKKV